MSLLSSTLEPPHQGNLVEFEPSSGGEPPAMIHRTIVASVLFLAGIVGAVGNALVILSVILSKKLRTSTNAFVVNLAVADFLTSLFLPFLALSLVIDKNPALPHWLCGTTIALIYICVCCSLFTLASIGLNRLLLITRPTHVCKKLFQPKVLLVWISCIWIYSVGVITMPLALDQGQLGYDEAFHLCGGVSSHPNSAVFEGVLVLGLYPVPLLIIIVSYVMLYAHIRLHGRRMLQGRGEPNEMSSTVTTKSAGEKRRVVISPTPSEVPSSPQVLSPTTKMTPLFEGKDSPTSPQPQSREITPDITPDITPRPLRRQLTTTCADCTPTLGQMRKSARKKISKRHLQITKNLFYVVVAFLLCLTPYFLVFVFNLKGEAVLYAAAAIFFNSCVNPFVYATKHPHFKMVFKCILSCNLKGVPEPASFLKSIDSVVNK